MLEQLGIKCGSVVIASLICTSIFGFSLRRIRSALTLPPVPNSYAGAGDNSRKLRENGMCKIQPCGWRTVQLLFWSVHRPALMAGALFVDQPHTVRASRSVVATPTSAINLPRGSVFHSAIPQWVVG
jgi:hypothetical protein